MGVLVEEIKAQRVMVQAFIQSLDKYLLSACFVPGIVLGGIVLQWRPRQARGTHSLVGKTESKQKNEVISGSEKCYEDSKIGCSIRM